MRSTAAGLVVLALCLITAGSSAAAGNRELIGRSVEGRAIVAWRQGDPNPELKVLAVGSIHGDERQGMRVVSRLRQRLAGRPGPKGIGLWTIKTTNPDGIAAGTRKNARGVDLNRNFPFRWDGSLEDGYYSGPRPASEPETRAVMKLSREADFDLAIWFHQPWGRTLAPCGEGRHWGFLYARFSGVETGGGCNRGHYPGSAVNWQHHATGATAFVVELGPGGQSRRTIKRNADAVIRLAKRMKSAG